ncbi:hypothetical protein ACJA25_02225 [Mycoplasmopsis hyopharyngis]|uniref:hypothetical protein n=1 Tax=Mycoplasmopsis hyopharyngis TaxID=29558 RepID=UPI003872C3A0
MNSFNEDFYDNNSKPKRKRKKILPIFLSLATISILATSLVFLVKNIKNKNARKEYNYQLDKINDLMQKSNVFLNTDFATEEMKEKMNLDLILTMQKVNEEIDKISILSQRYSEQNRSRLFDLQIKLKGALNKSMTFKKEFDAVKNKFTNLYQEMNEFNKDKFYKFIYSDFRISLKEELEKYKKYINVGSYFPKPELESKIKELDYIYNDYKKKYSERESLNNELSNLISTCKNFADVDLNIGVFTKLKIQLTREINYSYEFLYKSKVENIHKNLPSDPEFIEVNIESIKKQIKNLDTVYQKVLEEFRQRNKIYNELKSLIAKATNLKNNDFKIYKRYAEISIDIETMILEANRILYKESTDAELLEETSKLEFYLLQLNNQKNEIDAIYVETKEEIKKVFEWLNKQEVKATKNKTLYEEVKKLITDIKQQIEAETLKKDEVNDKKIEIIKLLATKKQELTSFELKIKNFFFPKLNKLQQRTSYFDIKIDAAYPIKKLKEELIKISTSYDNGEFTTSNIEQKITSLDTLEQTFEDDLKKQKEIIEKVKTLWNTVDSDKEKAGINNLYQKYKEQVNNNIDMDFQKKYIENTNLFNSMINDSVTDPKFTYENWIENNKKFEEFKTELKSKLN